MNLAFRSRSRLPFVGVAIALTACSASPRPRGTCLYPWPTDVIQQRAIEAKGDCTVGDEVVLWTPQGSVSTEERQSWLTRLATGVRAAKDYVHRSDWQFEGDERVYFYFADAQFVCHAPPGNTVYIPLWRMRENQAPWMHETMHLLIASRRGEWFAESEETMNARMPLWLHEGLAESLAIDVDERLETAHYSPIIDVPASGLDVLCRERLENGPGARVLAYVGSHGKMPELFSEQRMQFAPAFYTASASFIRFLQRRHGREALLQAIDSHAEEHEVLERAIGMPLFQAKTEWLEAIGYRGPR